MAETIAMRVITTPAIPSSGFETTQSIIGTGFDLSEILVHVILKVQRTEKNIRITNVIVNLKSKL